MNFCEVITEFKVEHFEVLKQKINLDNTLIITTTLSIQEESKKLGYNVEWIDEYFGYSNPRIYSIYEKAIKNMVILRDSLNEIKYNGVKIIDGLKFQILFAFVFLEEVKSILEEGKNVVFLLPNTEYHFFSIPYIANEIGHMTKYGVCTIQNLDIVPLKFDETKSSDPRFLYHDTRYLYGDISEPNQDIKPSVIEILSKIKFEKVSEFGFFLNNNETDLYLKPVYPVLDKFQEENTDYTIFTTHPRATEQLIEKGYKSQDISLHTTQLFPFMLSGNKDIILTFINKGKSCSEKNMIMRAYLSIFKNDAMARAIARILSMIEIFDVIFGKFKFKSVLVALDGTPDNDLVCGVAKKHRVTTFSIMPTMATENLSPIFGLVFNADKLLLPGKRFKEELEKLGVSRDRLLVVGSPRYEYVKKNQRHDERRIIIAMTRWHENDDIWISELIRYCNQNNFEVLIKPHPMYNVIHKEFSKEIINNIEKRSSGLKYNLSYDADLKEMIPRSTILITDHSTVGIEASLNEMPIIVANLHGEDYFNYDFNVQFHKENIGLYATTTDELFTSINKVMHDKKIQIMLKNGRKKFNAHIQYTGKESASERIYHLLISTYKKPRFLSIFK